MIIYRYLTFLIGLLLFAGCELQYKDFELSTGEVDFGAIVTIGDSYTAGYMDNALFKQGQEKSFAGIISKQLQSTGSTVLKAPLLPENTSIGSSLNGRYELQIVNGSLAPVATGGNPELLTDPTTWINAEAPFANVGVPGAKVIHVVSPLFGDYTLGEGNFNPYYARFASNPGTSTVIGDALLNNPTFFTFWIGTYDVLDYAVGGGEGSIAGIGSGDITDITTFTQAYQGAIAMIFASADKGAIGNIPNILNFPMFTKVPYNGLFLTAEEAAGLNRAYEGFPGISFSEGYNAFVIADDNAAAGKRQITANEKILLLAQSGIVGSGWGSTTPMPESMVLKADEVKAIEDATSQFNAIIKSQADKYGFAFVDMNKYCASISDGISVDGNNFSSQFVTGGFYSLDAIHTSERGACLVANEFIKSINSTYGANIPLARVNNYEGIVFP